jgi:hypothetical protein
MFLPETQHRSRMRHERQTPIPKRADKRKFYDRHFRAGLEDIDNITGKPVDGSYENTSYLQDNSDSWCDDHASPELYPGVREHKKTLVESIVNESWDGGVGE